MDTILRNLVFVFVGISILGFGVLGWYVRTLRQKVLRLYGGKISEKDAAENVIRRVMNMEETLQEFSPKINALESVAKTSVQKMGFLRFNPFQDTGGDNSFALALLDSEDNGVLISSFYAREGVRVYAKNIVHGKTRYPLSEEEKKVLDDTMKKVAHE